MSFHGAILLLTLTAVSGCLSSGHTTRLTADYAAGVRKVGVMSLLDSKANVSHLGPSAKESAFAELALSGWEPHALVNAALTERLQRRGFTVSAVEPNEIVLEALGDDWGVPDGLQLRAALYALAADLHLDMLVVASRQVSPDVVTGTNQKIRGYGIQRAFDGGPYAYAVIFVQALDVAGRFAAGAATGVQISALPAELWPKDFAGAASDVPVTGASAVRDILTDLVTTSLGVAAREAGL
jgi:hypothetical protein